MPPLRNDGFRALVLRVKNGGDETAWDDLLARVLPDLWQAAIQTVGDGDPPAVGSLVGSTLVAVAAELDEFQPAEDDAATLAAFGEWWRSLMAAAAARRSAISPPAPTDRPQDSGNQAAGRGWESPPTNPAGEGWKSLPTALTGRGRESPPTLIGPPRTEQANRRHGQRLVALVRGMSSPPSDVQRETLVHELLPLLWRWAIHLLGDGEPQQVGLLVEETVAAVLAQLGDAPVTEDDLAFDRWWQSLMAQRVNLLPG